MANTPQKPTTAFGGPPDVFVAPGVDPHAAAYAAGAAARAQARIPGLPKYAEPVGGGQAPPIPRLDAPHVPGRTMASQALEANGPRQTDMMAGLGEVASRPGSIVEPPVMMPGVAKRPAAPIQLMPSDMLPEEATRDPAFQHGHGSVFATSQPELARKYGVIRNGQRVPPQALGYQPGQQSQGGGVRGQLSPETLQGLRELQELQNRTPAVPQTDREAEEHVAASAAGQSARAGAPMKPKEEDLNEEERKKIKEAIDGLDSFDYDTWRQQMQKDVLNNPEQQSIIEGRLKPLDIDDLIIKNRVSQDVPIVPGKFIVRYTSMTGEDDLALKRLIMLESKSIEVTERYLLDKFAFMALTCGITAINNNSAPTHLDKEGNFNDDLFWLKFHWIMKRPLHMLASVGCNHTWFEQRVRKLFVAEKVGNG